MKMTAFAMTAFALVSAAQAPAPTPAADLELAVTRFLETANQYAQTFHNLTVEEKTVHEEFDQEGRIRKRREIVADLVVYRPARSGAGQAVEYRDARLVDGKAVAQRGKRALDLITRASTSTTLAEELRLINQASQRFDFDRHAGPFTIYQLPRDTMREDFQFTWVGRAQLNGHDVIELEYRELPGHGRPTGLQSMYKAMGITSFFERGRLWLDAATYQFRRSRWEINGVHPAVSAPILLFGQESAYVESRFGILVPERIVVEWHENLKSKAKPVFARKVRTTYTYGEFKQFGVTTNETVATPTDR
jgi:hypothetical protein